jgi:hypothetical protein
VTSEFAVGDERQAFARQLVDYRQHAKPTYIKSFALMKSMLHC